MLHQIEPVLKVVLETSTELDIGGMIWGGGVKDLDKIRRDD